MAGTRIEAYMVQQPITFSSPVSSTNEGQRWAVALVHDCGRRLTAFHRSTEYEMQRNKEEERDENMPEILIAPERANPRMGNRMDRRLVRWQGGTNSESSPFSSPRSARLQPLVTFL
ncbi:hypothetical protein Dimus_014708 [Dionaea muscipula]